MGLSPDEGWQSDGRRGGGGGGGGGGAAAAAGQLGGPCDEGKQSSRGLDKIGQVSSSLVLG